MPGLTHNSNEITPAVWAADYLSPDHLMIGPIELDPTAFPMDDGTFVVVGSAGAAIGATSIPVDALANAIPSGAFLNFGAYAPVTVTLADASVSAGDTTITVAALSGPIPAGAVLDFTAGTNAQLVKLSAAAITGATSLTIYPADGTIANTQTATFNGGTKQARLTAAADAAATSITVDELQFALVDRDTATYAGSGTQKRRVAAGTYVGRTFTERETDLPFGPVATGDEERFLVAFDVLDLDDDASGTAVRHGTAIKENFLPEYAQMTSTIKGYLRADYATQKGVA